MKRKKGCRYTMGEKEGRGYTMGQKDGSSVLWTKSIRREKMWVHYMGQMNGVGTLGDVKMAAVCTM